MARGYAPLPLSPMSGGVNRFEKESSPTQSADAIDVISSGGTLQRRGGMTTTAVGAPHHLPAGATNVKTYDSSYADLTDRQGSISAKTTFYVGCDEKFDGIDWPGSANLTVSISAKKTHYLEAEYWDGSDWVAIPFVHDTTMNMPQQTSSDGAFTQTNITNRACAFTLSQHGHISWHTDEHLEGWAKRAVDSGDSKYYVKLMVKSEGSLAPMLSGSSIDYPGVRAFKLSPVNGLFPVRLKGRSVLVVGTDRFRRGGATRRGVELGAQLGFHTNTSQKTETAGIVLDEGACVVNRVTNDASAGSTYQGTAGVITKTKKTFTNEAGTQEDYEWLFSSSEPHQGQFLGAIISSGLVPTGSPTTTVVKLNDDGGTGVADDFEHCRLRVTTAGGSGPAVKEEREIVSYNSTTGYLVYPAFSSAPTTADRFAVYRPHASVRYESSKSYSFGAGARVTRTLEIASHNAHELTPVDGSSLKFAEDFEATQLFSEFEISRELRWSMAGGNRWCGAYDPVVGHLVLTNGEGPLLTFDGYRLRELKADDSSDLAGTLAATIPEEAFPEDVGTSLVSTGPNAKFRPAPPVGDYVVDYMGRLVVADPDTNLVAWSMPSLANDIWPFRNETRIRDDENNAITGMATLHDRLYVFTSSAIFGSTPQDASGMFGFVRVSHGVGFSSHHSVQRISAAGSSMLVGAAADGVYMFNGSEPVAILDDWKRLLPEGVNRSGMDDACATVSLAENRYYLAVPSAGSDRNDRILVFDWSRKQWWVFSAPYGAASLATDYDENGNERVLVGTYDGHVSVLSSRETDDGKSISAKAKSPVVSPLGAAGRGASFVALMLDMKNMGTQTVSVNTYTDRQKTSRESSSGLAKTLKVDAGLAVWGTGVWGTAAWGDSRTKTVRLNMPSGARGHQIQYEISGSGSWELSSALVFVRPLGPRGRR